MNVEYLSAGVVLHGKYRINSVIGQGGFGITYDGTDLKLNMHVAIKEFFPWPIATRQVTYSQDVTCRQETASLYEQGLRNFLREAQNMAKFVGETNFVAVHDYFAENNTAYIIMEFVKGEDLRHYLKRRGPLSFQEAMLITAPVMDALEMIHARKMIHRDISPSNIMILPDGRVKLLDFGAVRDLSMETQTMTTMSAVYKHGYSPIEQQTRDMKQGTFSDIYALCATIYQMLTGTIPPSPFARISGSEALIPPSRKGVRISPMQERTLLRGLAIYGSDRPQTIHELRKGFFGKSTPFFGRADKPESGHTERLREGYRSPRRRQQVGIALVCIAVMILLVTGVFFLRRESHNEIAVKQAEEDPLLSSVSPQQPDDNEEEPSEEKSSVEENSIQLQAASGDSKEDPIEQESEETVSGNGGEASAAIETGNNYMSYDYHYPEGAIEYNGHHYYIYNDNTGSWEDAGNLCLSRGGYMAVINDSEENEVLYQLIVSMGYDVAYFGLARDDQGDWEYSEGDSSSYRDWGVNIKGEQEPNDLDGPSKYATMNIYMTDGHWDDVEYGAKVYTPEGKPYQHLYTYICEWDE